MAAFLIRRMSGLAALSIAAAVAAGPAVLAQGTGAFSGLGGDNSKKPIDIESDRLEVDDKTQVAIFIGNVSATQGDNNLKSQRLEVTYERKSDDGETGTGSKKPAKAKPTPASTAPDPSDPMGSGQVRSIKAIGGVIVTSTKDDQKATGKEGFFDVKEQKITMSGNVVLTQKGNVVKCARLNIDLNTSKSVCIPEDSDGKGGKPPRVTAVLKREGGGGETPSPSEAIGGSKKKKAEKSADDAQKPAETPKAPAGWQTRSQ
jgi:lipopolysaccharide export system protein LptA